MKLKFENKKIHNSKTDKIERAWNYLSLKEQEEAKKKAGIRSKYMNISLMKVALKTIGKLK